MNPKVKKKWLKALRSGKYKQGKERLRETTEGKQEYCCLGVLSDIHREETKGHWNGFELNLNENAAVTVVVSGFFLLMALVIWCIS